MTSTRIATWLAARTTSLLTSAVVICLAGCATPRAGTIFSPGNDDSNYDPFEVAIHRAPAAKTLYAMAHMLQARGHDTEASWTLYRLLRDYPDFAPAYSSLSGILIDRGRTEEAVQVLKSGLALLPNDPVLLNDMGMCLLAQKDYHGAYQRFSAASAATPQNARYRANMALAAGLTGRYDESLSLFTTIVPPAAAQFNLGLICRATGNTERADIAFQEAERLGKKVKM